MNDIDLTLRMNLQPDAPEGPGWYVYAVRQGDQAALIAPMRVAPQGAHRIAREFEHVMQLADSVPITPSQIVESGNNLIRHAVSQELREAEAAAKKIKGLRQALQAFDDASGTVEAQHESEEQDV